MFTASNGMLCENGCWPWRAAILRVTAGALTGSVVAGAVDAWSDIDLFFGIADDIPLTAVLDDWTAVLDQELGALHHWDLPSGASIYRVFLLPGGLEVDVGVTPAPQFGARGPHFRLLFGTPHPLEPVPPPVARTLVGLAWHHVLHARSAIERGQTWRAAHWIGGVRDQTFALACLRLGEVAYAGRGFDRLPVTVTDPLTETLVRSLDELELRRALAAATTCLLRELEAGDPALGARLCATSTRVRCTPTPRNFPRRAP